ncbi:MAG TPA: LysM peptidoglycan-binding domain-containing protein, partial [Spirochaetota bacterium]|nr:LysM peptidoglycan-binding domain-containing protein [Spirochaetota bacterium]
MGSVKRITALIFTAGLVVVFGCGDPLPVKEMVDARYAITRADGVSAGQYAPDLFKEATSLLLKSHEDVKAEKWDDAKKDAESALAKANDAYNASVPLLAKDALDKADKSVAEAGDVYASELANADYANAAAKLKSAHEQFEAKKYEDAYTLAKEADSFALNAKTLSINKKGTLKDAIDEVSETVSRTEKLGGESYAPEKLKLAKENLAIAQKSYDDLKLKDGFSAVQVAKINADEAFLESLKKSAIENIAKAESMIADAEKNPNAKDASNEVDGAKEMVKTAKGQYESGQYPESIQSADEAKRLVTIALSIIEKSGNREGDKDGDGSKVASTGKDSAKSSDKTVQVSDEGSGEYDIYVVRYFKSSIKDCLWLIAGKYYKNPRQWKKIYNANRDKIRNPDFIRPGWKLKVPKKAPVKKAEEPVAPVSEEKSEAAEPQVQETPKAEEQSESPEVKE